MLITLYIAKALYKYYLKKVIVYKELNVLLNAILVGAMAQISYNQINEVQKAQVLFFSSKNHLFIGSNVCVWLFKDKIFVAFF